MVHYENSKIYKIWSVLGDKIYIGSTTQSLAKRMGGHRSSYKAYQLALKLHISSYYVFDEYGVENCQIELIECSSCENRIELHRKEGEHIRKYTCVNKNIAGRSSAEYYDNNKAVLKKKCTV